ncbi:MAG: CCA tRNA nucleotidyltransferase, partial [Kordiimonas sp.]
LQHGTVTAVLDSKHLEVTTLRVDVETDGRHAEVAYTKDWLEDAKRRDFTFNALYLTSLGELFDPFGGEQDLVAGRVRFIGDAKERIQEDALRVLRLFRFQALLGKEAIEPSALDACRHLSSMLKSLSVERVRSELSKLLKAQNPIFALEEMQEAKVFHGLGIEEVSLSVLKEYVANESFLDAEIDPLTRLSRLFSQSFDAQALSKWLKLSNKQKGFLKSLEQALAAETVLADLEMRRYIYQRGQTVSSAAAICLGNKALYSYSLNWSVPIFPVQGRDLMVQGMLAGPKVGEALSHLEAKWIESDFTLSKSQLLKQSGPV